MSEILPSRAGATSAIRRSKKAKTSFIKPNARPATHRNCDHRRALSDHSPICCYMTGDLDWLTIDPTSKPTVKNGEPRRCGALDWSKKSMATPDFFMTDAPEISKKPFYGMAVRPQPPKRHSEPCHDPTEPL